MNIKKVIGKIMPIKIKRLIKTKLLLKRNTTCIFKKNTNISLDTKFGRFVTLFENVEIGFTSFIDDCTYIQKNTSILNSNIGKFCSIAKNVTIGLVGHPINMVSTNPCFYDYDKGLLPKFFVNTSLEKETLIPKTNIDSDVWIGQNVMIKSGVTIGVGAVIGAGAIVTKDIEPYSVVAGVPAKHIKYRFDKVTREKLLFSKWWEFDEKKLEKLAPYFNMPEIFLDKLKEFDEI